MKCERGCRPGQRCQRMSENKGARCPAKAPAPTRDRFVAAAAADAARATRTRTKSHRRMMMRKRKRTVPLLLLQSPRRAPRAAPPTGASEARRIGRSRARRTRAGSERESRRLRRRPPIPSTRDTGGRRVLHCVRLREKRGVNSYALQAFQSEIKIKMEGCFPDIPDVVERDRGEQSLRLDAANGMARVPVQRRTHASSRTHQIFCIDFPLRLVHDVHGAAFLAYQKR